MKRVLQYLRPYRLWIVLSVLGTALGSLAELFLPMLLANIINAGSGAATGVIVKTGLWMLLASVLSIALAVVGNLFSSRAATFFSRDTRNAVFGRVQTFTQADINSFGTASLITRATNDVVQVQNFLLMFVRIIVRSPVMLIGGVIMAYAKSSGLARPLLVSVPLIIVFIVILSRFAMPYFKIYQKKLDRVNLVLREQIHGIRVTRAFGNEDYEEKRFDEANLDMTQTGLKMMRTISVMMPGLMVIMNLTTVAIVWFGGLAANMNSLMPGDLLAVIQYVMQIMFSLVMMSMVFVMYPRAATSAERIANVLDTEPQISDTESTVSPSSEPSVIFQNVSFTFPNAERPALEGIDFSAKKGETVAIIGSTGSGKSSILNLILRFYDVSSGAVLVNGVDVRSQPGAELRARIGYVPQQSQLFSGTIAHNLRYGNASADSGELSAVAEIAQSLDFINEKDDGFDYHVAQGGENLSGGQKQRLSIARAILRKPDIYLFDDSFSALDFATDTRLRAALRRETGDSIVIIVAQRVATIMNADKIIVLDEGRVAGIGTHKELVASCNVYSEIVYSQLSNEEVAQ